MRKQLLYVCPLLLVAASAWGATCANTSLANYTASGFSCTLDGLTFSNFTYFANPTTGLPTAASISVNPVNSSGTVGFDFGGPFISLAGTSTDALLSYNISALAGEMMTADSVTLLSAAASGTNAVAEVAEGVCAGTQNANGSCNGNNYSLSASVPGSNSQTVTLGAGVSFQTVVKNIITQGATTGTGNAAISLFENVTTVSGGGGNPGGGTTPEPTSMLSLGSGLVITSMLLRRKLRKN